MNGKDIREGNSLQLCFLLHSFSLVNHFFDWLLINSIALSTSSMTLPFRLGCGRFISQIIHRADASEVSNSNGVMVHKTPYSSYCSQVKRRLLRSDMIRHKKRSLLSLSRKYTAVYKQLDRYCMKVHSFPYSIVFLCHCNKSARSFKLQF